MNLPGLPKKLQYAPAGSLPASDLSSVAGLYDSTGFPYFGQSAAVYQQPSYVPSFYESPKFTDDELRLFAANFANSGLDVSQIFGTGAAAAAKTAAGKAPADGGERVEINESAAAGAEKSAGPDEKKAVQDQSAEAKNAPKKSNAVQIVQDDVFNGQLPLL